jgi:arylsulfatase A-like enzyme
MLAHFTSQYDGEVAFVDVHLARIFDALKSAKRYDRSLIILTADHGELLGEHGLAGHGSIPYEELVHVPLVIKYPGERDGGTRVERRVSTVGTFATILEQLHVRVPAGTQSPPIERDHPVWVEDILTDGSRWTAGYEGSAKLIAVDTGREIHTEVFDLARDPRETSPDLSGRSAASLRTALASFRALSRPVKRSPPPVIDPERELKLRLLGYIR